MGKKLLWLKRALVVALMLCVSFPLVVLAESPEATPIPSGQDLWGSIWYPYPHFSTTTSIAYSSGHDSNWSYGNQRKEFPSDGITYVRIGTTAISSNGQGENSNIVVTYRFTGVTGCNVEVSDGIAEKLVTEDPNVAEFRATIYAHKEKNAKEDVIIFRYEPTDARSITMDVVYDALVDEQFDTRSTIYFNQSNIEGTTLDVEEMTESDLLVLLQRVTDALADYGYTVTYDKK